MRHGLIDHDAREIRLHVLTLKEASIYQVDTQRLEEARADSLIIYNALLRSAGNAYPAFNLRVIFVDAADRR